MQRDQHVDLPPPARPPLVRLIWDDVQAGNVAAPRADDVDPEEVREMMLRRLELAELALFMDITVAGRINAAHGSEYLLQDLHDYSHLPPTSNVFFEAQRPQFDAVMGHVAHCGPFGVAQAAHILTSRTDTGFHMHIAHAVRWEHGAAPVFPVGVTEIDLDGDGRILRNADGHARWLDHVSPFLEDGSPQCLFTRQTIWIEPVLRQLAMLNGYVYPKFIRRQLGVAEDRPQGALRAEVLSERAGDVNEHRAVISSLVRANRLRDTDPQVSITDRMVAKAFGWCEHSLESALDGWAILAQGRESLLRMGDDEARRRLAPVDELMLEVIERHVAVRGLGATPGSVDRIDSDYGGVHLTVEHVGPNVRRILLESEAPNDP